MEKLCTHENGLGMMMHLYLAGLNDYVVYDEYLETLKTFNNIEKAEWYIYKNGYRE
jgi:hypothetical protein